MTPPPTVRIEPPAGAEPPPLLAVTAVAGRFPGAPGVDDFWPLLRDGRSGLTRFTDNELAARGVPATLRRRADYVPVGGLIDGQDLFDPVPFGLTDAEAALMDPQHRLFLETAWEALERAGHGGGAGIDSIGVFAGAAQSAYLASNLTGRWDPTGGRDPIGSLETTIATQADYLPLQTAYRLNLTGPAMNITTTCSTSLVAVHVAAQALLAGECDAAVAGGVSLIVPQGHGYRYVPDGIFAIDGTVRPFSARGTGVVYSQGVGAVVLRRLDEALADGDPVLAVLHGSAIGNDGADKVGFTAPSLRGQARVIAEALAVAGLTPSDVGYVEAHGTGTRLGDPIEIAALRTAFGHADGGTEAWCGLGSVKSNIGHANSAAGIASFIKTVLAIQHRTLPASLHAEPINEQLGLHGSPFSVVTRTRAWDTAPYAGVSSFGIGGTNAHVLLGPAPDRPASPPDERPQILVFSAHDRAALDATVTDTPGGDLPDTAHTLQRGRTHFPHRRAVVTGPETPTRHTPPARADGVPRVVFLFPGGGSQYPGMATGLYAAEPVFAAAVDEFAALFRERLGTDVRTLITGGDDAMAYSAATGLPALFTVSVATARLLGSWGIVPDALLGHSLGEYAAAVVSGALTAPDAATLVAVRSQALAGAAGGGAMLSVPLPEPEIVALLDAHPGADLAAVNAPDSGVVSGPAEIIDALAGVLAARGLSPSRLPLNSAAHSRLIDPELPRMRRAARSVRAGRPAVPTISSLTGGMVGDDFADPEHWVRQLRAPVRFSAALRTALAESTPTVLVQAGPGAALVAAARGHRIAHLAATVTTFTRDDVSDLAAARLAAGELWTHGVPVDFSATHRPGRRRVLAPGYAFQRRRLWIQPAERAPQPDAAAAELLQVARWTQEPTPAPVTALGGRWLILGDTAGAATVAAALRGHGAEAGGTDEVSAPVDGVVLVAPAGGDPDRAAELILGHGAAAATVAALDPPPPILLQVTERACRVESADRPAPAATAARALPRVIAQEQPGLSWRTLDVPDLPAAGPAIVAELADLRTGPSLTEVAVRGGLRWSSRMAPWPAPTDAPAVRPGATALIIGGLGDVGLTVAAHLAAKGMRIVVTSRSGARTDGVDELRRRGHDVSVRVLDAGDAAATAALLADLSAGSALDVVVHAAGVVASGDLPPMRRIEAAHVDGHLHAKARGALSLHAAIAALADEDRPRRVILMSSAGTLVGGIGTGPYSAGNGFLNGLAERLPADGTRWVSVVWDAWKVGPLGTEREVNLDYALDAATGMRALDAILAACDAGVAPPVVAVSTTDLRARMAVADRPAPRREARLEHSLTGVAAEVAEAWSELFGTPVGESDADFFALGGHSLLATRMLVGLAERYRIRLSLRDLLARPTVAGLAETIAAAARAPEDPVPQLTGGVAEDGTFGMTRVQHAYWMGRSGGYRFGDTACHFALEYDCEQLDLDRYEHAWNRVIARHPMLRAITTGQGRMKQLDHVPHYRIRATDLTTADPGRREERLAKLREQVFRKPGPSDRWPLVQVRAARLPGGRVRLFLGVDVLVCDAGSYWIINRDLRHFYEHPDDELPAVPVTFAGCVAAMDARRGTDEWERAAGYWRERLESLPDAPALPVSTVEEGARFVRHAARLDAERWAAFKRHAAANGVTPTAALLTAYGELLAGWGGDDRFAVMLTLFDRPGLHPAVGDVVGDFTSLVLHEVDRRTPGTFGAHAQRAQRTLFTDLDHRLFSALDVLAEKSAGSGTVASVPVVFTSALGLDDVIGGEHDLEWAGRQIGALSQTPQVVLDHQVIERDGELLVQWDTLEPVLDPSDVDRAFDRYLDRLRELADPESWRRRPVAAEDVAVTLRAADTAGQTLFLIHPSGGDVTCYTELALQLDERVTVVGLTDPGFAGADVPAELPRLARLYADVIRTVRPHGPYLLGGWSMGGSLGQDVARTLHAQGEHVALLLMLDSNDPGYITAMPGDADEAEGQVLVRHLGALEAYLGVDLGVGTPGARAELLAEPTARRWERATERLRAHRLLGAREDLRARLAVFDRHLRGLAGHRPAPHTDDRTHTVLIRADRTATRNSGIGMGVDDTPAGLPDLGWSAHLATPPEVTGVDADHYSLMRRPAIDTVAKLINAALDRHL
ncbi:MULTISPECIES: SDR family NAD(P)-dependent oxidoreductase [Catenuloplanes]|uniref:Acyl transferase domain-containing protein/thioesterase domain-containing protein/acyl carrier protein n=1 Tax=Catenuloplanes niger TaxID=587534 RepID=A0AAE3ZYX8_9ACTN|nr:SDR family NAD(P)-dependent oxidoreductase [Catenuloplanes niger]MDR7327485.1 acyl transferase domain-containing protein/thioesterase domain-containing protein/acyl carrier protein [Catenuloplanes niger]